MNYLELKSKCSECGKENQFLLAPNELDSICCEDCGFCIVEINSIYGFVYVASNPAFPTYLKVGFTEKNAEERIRELDAATGLPKPFVLEAYYYSSEPRADEQRIHAELEDYRVSEKREFFELDLESAISKIGEILKRSPYYQGERLLELHKKKEEEQEQREEEDAKRKKEQGEKTRREQHITFTCGACGAKIPMEKGKGNVGLQCTKCFRVALVKT